MRLKSTLLALALSTCLVASRVAAAPADNGLFPPLSAIKPDHPRLLVRPHATRLAVSLADLRDGPRDADYIAMLDQLKQRTDDPAAQAMVWLLTGDAAAAERAVARMRAYKLPGKVDTFEAWFRLRAFAFAYDWLYDAPQFSKAARAEVRAAVAPLVTAALRMSDDHVFHNYVWMSSGGLSLWALATAGEDDDANRVYATVRQRFNERLFPTLRYLEGLPSEPMGYWSFYVFTPAVLTVLAGQSATETDLVASVRSGQDNWLERNFDNLIQFTLPDMRFVPWGDLQGGPNGGVTKEMAGTIDAATWALGSARGRWFGRWLAGKRGLQRFEEQTPLFYMLYTRQLEAKEKAAGSGAAGFGALTSEAPGKAAQAKPADKPSTPPLPSAPHPSAPSPSHVAPPPLSHLAGGKQGGQFIARTGWDDGDTIVGFRCADFMGDHHHYDQGSFLIYRRGPLAVDPPVYKTMRGPQGETGNHNTLLIGGKPQRPARGQTFNTLEKFRENLTAGKRLETGDLTFSHDAGPWAAVAGQFTQAYDEPDLKSCVRQLLLIRKIDAMVVVDRLVATPGKQVPQVAWLLQTPAAPREDDAGGFVASNAGPCWLRCRPILPGGVKYAVAATPVNTQAVSFAYAAKADVVVLVHVLDVGDGAAPRSAGPVVKASAGAGGVEVFVEGIGTFDFESDVPYRVTARGRAE